MLLMESIHAFEMNGIDFPVYLGVGKLLPDSFSTSLLASRAFLRDVVV